MVMQKPAKTTFFAYLAMKNSRGGGIYIPRLYRSYCLNFNVNTIHLPRYSIGIFTIPGVNPLWQIALKSPQAAA